MGHTGAYNFGSGTKDELSPEFCNNPVYRNTLVGLSVCSGLEGAVTNPDQEKTALQGILESFKRKPEPNKK